MNDKFGNSCLNLKVQSSRFIAKPTTRKYIIKKKNLSETKKTILIRSDSGNHHMPVKILSQLDILDSIFQTFKVLPLEVDLVEAPVTPEFFNLIIKRKSCDQMMRPRQNGYKAPGEDVFEKLLNNKSVRNAFIEKIVSRFERNSKRTNVCHSSNPPTINSFSAIVGAAFNPYTPGKSLLEKYCAKNVKIPKNWRPCSTMRLASVPILTKHMNEFFKSEQKYLESFADLSEILVNQQEEMEFQISRLFTCL